MIGAIQSAYHRLDYAFNNAGVLGKAAAIHDTDVEEFDRVLSVNIRGQFLALKAQIPFMLATSPAPAIVMTASVVGHVAYPGQCHYVASKHALLGLAKVAAAEYGPRGLRVNTVSPGPIITPFHDSMDLSGDGRIVCGLMQHGAAVPHVHGGDNSSNSAGHPASTAATENGNSISNGTNSSSDTPQAAYGQQVSSAISLKRKGVPAEVAECVVFLCMEGKFVTGQDLVIDGGMISRMPA
eukprot:gene8544-8727_t